MRVLVLTAPIGDGHLSAARVLADDITTLRPDVEVVLVDALAELPRTLAWLFRDAYRWQLSAAPWLFALLFGALRRSAAARALSRLLLSLTCSRSVLRLAEQARADLIVSTWPVTTTVLGCLRLRGKLQQPVCATITDFAGLELWADRGVDRHLVMHPALVGPVERVAGKGSVEAVAPLVATKFCTPYGKEAARSALGLSHQGRLVAVSGGGWGVGDLEGAARAALELPDTAVVCLAGRDEATRLRLEAIFGADARVVVLGFTDRMNDLLAAADVLVHSTGGVTCLEAIARGCRIVAYRPPPGHCPLLAREMAGLGLLSHARSPAEFRAALLHSPPVRPQQNAVASARRVLELRPRVRCRLRSRLARPLAAATATALCLGALSTSALAYRPMAEIFQLPDETVIGSHPDEVGLVVAGRRQDLLRLAETQARPRVRISVISTTDLSAADIPRLRRAGLDPIVALNRHGLGSWLQTKRDLARQKAQLGLRKPFPYLIPASGLTVSEYLIARHLGGRPIPAAALRPRFHTPIPGTVALANLKPGRAARRALLRELANLKQHGETPVSVGRLLATG